MLKRLSLGSRFALFFAGSLALAALAVYAVLSSLAVRQSERQAQRSVQVAGKVMSRLVAAQAESLRTRCQILIDKTGMGQLVVAADRATINDVLSDQRGSLGADDAVLVNRDGRVLGGTRKVPLSAVEKKRLDAGENWSGIAISGNRPELVVVTPILDPASRERQGALLAYRRIDDRLAGELAAALDARIAFTLDGAAVAASGPATGEAVFRTRTTLPDDATGGRLALLLLVPRRQLLDGSEREKGLILTGFLLALVLGMLLGVRLVRRLTRPLEDVIAAARRVRAGAWPEPLPVRGQGELGLLQEVFNEMTASLKANQLVTIQTLAAAVDARDAYTRGHSDRVAEYARRLAEAMGLPPERVERIHTIGTLHDVGKIAIPDAVLLKPGPLTPEERTIMESHSIRSEEVIRNVPALAATLPGIRHHHERWDGRGYPDGLAGDAIPLEARLLALADTFDALTSDRPYRRGWSHGRALTEIERCSGAQFDPDLVPLFLALWPAEARGEPELRLAA